MCCFSFAAQSDGHKRLTSRRLEDVRAEAHGGNRNSVAKLIRKLQRFEPKSVDRDALPVLKGFLEDDDADLQLVGAMGLYTVKDPSTKPAIVNFLEKKDFKELEKKAIRGEIGEREYESYVKAATYAILTLGHIGDRDVVPLLKSLRDVEDLKFEMGGGPAHQALAQLGAVDTLTDVPVEADHREVSKAVNAIKEIRDPDKVPALMATVHDTTVASGVRHAALSAVGRINPSGIDDFLRGLLTDSETRESLQKSAAVVAGRSGRSQLEPLLLALAEVRKGPVAPYALAGLVLMKPDKYMKEWCADIMDPELDVDYRDRLVGLEFYFSRELLRQHKEDLYAFLKAAMPDGSPVDEIRLHAWRLIYERFDEKPKLELSEVSKGTRARLRHLLEREFMLADPHMGVETRDRKLDEEIRQIVTITGREETK